MLKERKVGTVTTGISLIVFGFITVQREDSHLY
jgi:hypothetical protein